MPSLIPEDLTQPGAHALVIGVSAYLHFADGVDPTPTGIEFDMEQLTAAAHSASDFAAWLLNDFQCSRAPLRSLRVLLSPAVGEKIHPDIAARLDGNSSATLNNVRAALAEFKHACDAHTENVLIVYIAGHGVQLTPHGAIVLLHDFGAVTHLNKLEGAIDMAGVHDGMDHPNTASTQFWFVDACRQKPEIALRFETLSGALTLDKPVGMTETSPMFLAAATGTKAYARKGGITLFNEALMWILQGGAAVGPEPGIKHWHIPVTSLIKYLPDRVNALAEVAEVEQTVEIAPRIHEAVFHEFAVAPKVDLTINLSPAEARSVSKGSLKYNAKVPIIENCTVWPIHQSVGAGLYIIDIQTSPPYNNIIEPIEIKPPEIHNDYDVTA